MSDADQREWERRWLATGDQAALERAIRDVERRGLPIPGRLIDGLRSPALVFESEQPFIVTALLRDGSYAQLGATPGTVAIPEHRAWWVKPPLARGLPTALDEIARKRLPGLSFENLKI